jgi:hypothetical protein
LKTHAWTIPNVKPTIRCVINTDNRENGFGVNNSGIWKIKVAMTNPRTIPNIDVRIHHIHSERPKRIFLNLTIEKPLQMYSRSVPFSDVVRWIRGEVLGFAEGP